MTEPDNPKDNPVGSIALTVGAGGIALLVIAGFIAMRPGAPSQKPMPTPGTLSALPAVAAAALAAPTSPKVYKTSDIDWEYTDIAKPYRERAVAGINKVLRENQRCADVQTTSLYRAEGFSKKKPIFFIICEAKGGGDPFGVTFNVNDVDTTKRFAAAAIIKESVAKRVCMEATEQEPAGLRAITFSPFFNGNFIPHDDGKATIALAFTAKNALGIKDDYKAICFFKGLAMTEHSIKPG
jgi:hypothetical protein